MDNQMLASAERQAKISQAMDAFLKQGGKIQTLESCAYKPLPARKHPEQKVKKLEAPAVKPPTKRTAELMARVERIAEMAKTMTCKEVATAIGMSQDRLWSISKSHGFNFVLSPRGRSEYEKYDDAKDAVMGERIKALHKIGVSKNKAALHLKIGHATLTRIANKFGIVFPDGKARKKA